MKKFGFYPRLAFGSLRKNRRFYLPYLCACAGMVTMFYIVAYLTYTPAIEGLRGVNTLRPLLLLGQLVIAAFALLFLLYTNEFLLRRRRREFGLYSVLGMARGGLARILVWENLTVYAISEGAGLALGILLSKLWELLLLRMVRGETDFVLRIEISAVKYTLLIFAGIFAVLLLRALWQVWRRDPIALLRSENVGEKPPRSNWLLVVPGVVLLIWAYYIAATTQNPLKAMALFFVAVLMVIVGTYLLFIAGSVTLCRTLQKNKGYYYQKKHFVSLSSMAYRMKRNGASLASICILSTMVLVMIGSSASLYIGAEDSVRTLNPMQLIFQVSFEDYADMSDSTLAPVRRTIEENAEGVTRTVEYRSVELRGRWEGQTFADMHGANLYSDVSASSVILVPLSDYNRETGAHETLEQNEALVCGYRTKVDLDRFNLGAGSELTVKRVLTDFLPSFDAAAIISTSIFVVVDDVDAVLRESGIRDDGIRYNYYIDTSLGSDAQREVFDRIRDALLDLHGVGATSYSFVSQAENRDDFYATYGGLFFIGLVLSLVFLFATVLMLYYKQISEGYEDRARFAILQKVGMTAQDIRQSINAQMRLVFLLPLGAALLHLGFAQPMIWRILQLFNLRNLTLVLCVTGAAFVLFAVLYCVMYRLTSNAYFRIVSTAE